MSRAFNPREMSDEALKELIDNNLCPMCLGELDTGWECNDCGYDAQFIAKCLSTTEPLTRPGKGADA